MDQHTGGVPVDTHSTPVHERDGCGWLITTTTAQHISIQCRYTANMVAEQLSIQGKSFGSKSTAEESLLCYGGPRDEEVDETIHENFDEKEKMKHEIAISAEETVW